MDFLHSLRCAGRAVGLAIPALLCACAAQLGEPISALDTPERHVSSGFRLMDREYLSDAKREFEHALGNDPDLSSAHRGLGLVLAMQGDFHAGVEALNRAQEEARDDRDRALALVALMQLRSWQRGEDWLHAVEDLFKEAVALVQPLPEAHYHMALAYKESGRLEQAEAEFNRVLEIDQVFVPQARQALAEMKSSHEKKDAARQ